LTGQAFEGDGLNIELLDERVFAWKVELGLIEQPEFPPKTVTMSEGSIRYHDRSHILVQDYLGKSSYDLQSYFEETSEPPVFEELLTYFFSKVAHRPQVDPMTYISLSVISEDIFLMRHLGYIDTNSIFITNLEEVSLRIVEYYRQIATREDFYTFIGTLVSSTRDCSEWSALLVHG